MFMFVNPIGSTTMILLFIKMTAIIISTLKRRQYDNVWERWAPQASTRRKLRACLVVGKFVKELEMERVRWKVGVMMRE